MTVTITVSSGGGYKVFSEENATLATAVSAVINELEEHKVPLSRVQFNTVYDDNNNKFAFIAICKMH